MKAPRTKSPFSFEFLVFIIVYKINVPLFGFQVEASVSKKYSSGSFNYLLGS
jgi:hypothetical protein